MKTTAMLRVACALPLIVSAGQALACPWSATNASLVVAQASAPAMCAQVYLPVCGRDGAGKAMTFPNDCEARRAGAIGIVDGPCSSSN